MIRAEKACWPVSLMCRILGLSRSGYYAWERRPPSARRRGDEAIVERICDVHVRSRGTYGSPRVHAALKREGEKVGRRRVARLMRQNGIRARRRRRRRRTTDSQHGLPVAPNLVGRSFTAQAPNRVWAADIKAVWTEEGWLYLAVVLDLFSRKVVGWAMAEHMRAELVLSALKMALWRRRPGPGLVHHSDRGSQYASHAYQDALLAAGILCSMSRKGDCYDNAVAESFFATLETELLAHASWATREGARTAIFEYMEGFYNRKRLHSHLGYLSPAEYEALALEPASEAA